MRVVVVVVVVRELLFIVTSVICVWIRGRGSEVTKSPYHIRSDFRLHQRSYQNWIRPTIPTLFVTKFHLVIWLLFWLQTATMSFLPSLSSMAAGNAKQPPQACFRFKGTPRWSAGWIISHNYNGVFWDVSSGTQRNASFKTKTDNRNKRRWMNEYLPLLQRLLQPPQKLGSCSNLCYRDVANFTLKTHAHE